MTVSGFMDALHQSGGSVFAEDGSVIVHSPDGIASLQRLVDLVHQHKVAPPGAASFDHVDNHTMFLQGQIGVTMNWQYAYSMFKDPSQSKVVGKFAIAPCPQNVVAQAGLVPGVWQSQRRLGTNRKRNSGSSLSLVQKRCTTSGLALLDRRYATAN